MNFHAKMSTRRRFPEKLYFNRIESLACRSWAARVCGENKSVREKDEIGSNHLQIAYRDRALTALASRQCVELFALLLRTVEWSYNNSTHNGTIKNSLTSRMRERVCTGADCVLNFHSSTTCVPLSANSALFSVCGAEFFMFFKFILATLTGSFWLPSCVSASREWLWFLSIIVTVFCPMNKRVNCRACCFAQWSIYLYVRGLRLQDAFSLLDEGRLRFTGGRILPRWRRILLVEQLFRAGCVRRCRAARVFRRHFVRIVPYFARETAGARVIVLTICAAGHVDWRTDAASLTHNAVLGYQIRIGDLAERDARYLGMCGIVITIGGTVAEHG